MGVGCEDLKSGVEERLGKLHEREIFFSDGSISHKDIHRSVCNGSEAFFHGFEADVVEEPSIFRRDLLPDIYCRSAGSVFHVHERRLPGDPGA